MSHSYHGENIPFYKCDKTKKTKSTHGLLRSFIPNVHRMFTFTLFCDTMDTC